MKSLLPVIVLIAGAAVILTLFAFKVLNQPKQEASTSEEDKPLPELSVDQRPYITLTPDSRGQELTLFVSKIPGSSSTLEYELVYVADGQGSTKGTVTRGVPGSIDIAGQTSIERKLTLGSCSSGVCRYDKNVKDINLTLRLRNSDGKLIAKSDSAVVLQTGSKEVSSKNKDFTVSFKKALSGYVVLLNTYGLPEKFDKELKIGPYGVFTSEKKVDGNISTSGTFYKFDKTWTQVSGKTTLPGVFVGIASD